MRAISPEVLQKLLVVEDSLDEVRQLLMANKATVRECREIKDLRISVSAIARQLQALDRVATH